MKLNNLDRLEVLALAFAVTVILMFLLASSSFSQGVNYSWSDSMTVSTAGRDSTFATAWESVNFWFRGGEGWIRFGLNSAGDTTNWSSKKWIRLSETQIISFDAGSKLKRLQFKGSLANVQAYFVGYKKIRQF